MSLSSIDIWPTSVGTHSHSLIVWNPGPYWCTIPSLHLHHWSNFSKKKFKSVNQYEYRGFYQLVITSLCHPYLSGSGTHRIIICIKCNLKEQTIGIKHCLLNHVLFKRPVNCRQLHDDLVVRFEHASLVTQKERNNLIWNCTNWIYPHQLTMFYTLSLPGQVYWYSDVYLTCVGSSCNQLGTEHQLMSHSEASRFSVL